MARYWYQPYFQSIFVVKRIDRWPFQNMAAVAAVVVVETPESLYRPLINAYHRASYSPRRERVTVITESQYVSQVS